MRSYFLKYKEFQFHKMKSSEDGQWKVQGGKRMGSRRDSRWGGGAGGKVKDLKSKLLYSLLIHYIHSIIILHILPIF